MHSGLCASEIKARHFKRLNHNYRDTSDVLPARVAQSRLNGVRPPECSCEFEGHEPALTGAGSITNRNGPMPFTLAVTNGLSWISSRRSEYTTDRHSDDGIAPPSNARDDADSIPDYRHRCPFKFASGGWVVRVLCIGTEVLCFAIAAVMLLRIRALDNPDNANFVVIIAWE
jgi:hypothetical protein